MTNILRNRLLLLLLSLSVLSCMADALPQSTSSQSQIPRPNADPNVLNPNAPSQGKITISLPVSAATWYTGTDQRIEWKCEGTLSNRVAVDLWKDAKKTVISEEVVTGRTAYKLPVAMQEGTYELRVTSLSDSRVLGRQLVNVQLAKIHIISSGDQLLSGSFNRATWVFQGDPGPVRLALLDDKGSVVQIIAASIPIGSGGTGSAPWYMPKTYVPLNYTLMINSVAFPNIQDKFQNVHIDPLKIKVAEQPIIYWMHPQSKTPVNEEMHTSWFYDEGIAGQVKIELLTSSGALTIAAGTSIGSGGKGSFSWTYPGEYCSGGLIKVTSLSDPNISSNLVPVRFANYRLPGAPDTSFHGNPLYCTK